MLIEVCECIGNALIMPFNAHYNQPNVLFYKALTRVNSLIINNAQ